MMKKPKILVVEDEKVVATDIEESLQKLGYTVVGGAASGISAIRKAVETDPDLILMDIKLKGDIDGVDAAGELHDRLGIPVVFLTAYADGEILDRAKRTSPSGYVLKPFDQRALRSAVEIALHQHPRERRLVESERRLVSALRSIDEGVLMTQQDGIVTLMNRAAERLTGWKQTEAIGKRVSDVFTSVNGATGSLLQDPIGRVIREGVSISLGDQRVLVSRHGAETWIRGNGVPLRDEDGEIVGAALVFHAAEVRMAAGEDLVGRSSPRMETAGRLIGGFAVEFAKSLDQIFARGAELKHLLRTDRDARHQLGQILHTADQMKKLSDRLARFSQRRVYRPRTLDLNSLLRGLDLLLECAAGENVEVIMVLSAETGKIVADPGHIEEIVLNLAAEARDSMPTGGKLTIETTDTELLGEYARAHTCLDAGSYAVICVSHTGSPAADPDNLANDLPEVYRLAHKAGGDIRLQAEPGRVATYEVFLPKADSVTAR